jgi:hypothetical protein
MAQTHERRENAKAVFKVLLPKLTAQEWGALVEGGDYPTTVAEARRKTETGEERRRRESCEREEERLRREKLQQKLERVAEDKWGRE